MDSTGWSVSRANLRVLALRTPTLPPATHTNTSFVGGQRFWVVDPATPYPEERVLLGAAFNQLKEKGMEPQGIVLTHHHQDHVGGAVWLQQETGLPICAHGRTARLLEGHVPVDQVWAEGRVLVGSDDKADRWEVLHTPGHASGHIVLWQAETGVLIAGDMVAEVGTIVVEPPDGDMAVYIAQLERLVALAPTELVPAHGALVTDPIGHLTHYITHRLAREAKVMAAVEQGSADLMTLTSRAYDDVPTAIHILASCSALAHLLKLEGEARVTQNPNGQWQIA